MSKPDIEPEKLAANIVGAKPAGLTETLAATLGERVEDVFRQSGKSVNLLGMRFIPSSKVDLGEGVFQVMANTIVEAIDTGRALPAQAFDSVVTIVDDPASGQSLEEIKIPALKQFVF